jgi:hypothetical protein
MIGGAGYVAGKSIANSRQREAGQEARLEDLEGQQQAPPAASAAPPPAAPAAAGGTDIVAKLTELKGLVDQGVLTQDEFEIAKKKLLAG